MYFNFDDRQPDIERIDSAISWREGLLLSLVVHLVAIVAIVMLPDALPQLFAALAPDKSALEERMAAMREQALRLHTTTDFALAGTVSIGGGIFEQPG